MKFLASTFPGDESIDSGSMLSVLDRNGCADSERGGAKR
jgi:hypothetical protein